MSSTREIDILYQPDPSKKKLLEFFTPTITINNNQITIKEDGFIENLTLSDIIDISFKVYPYDVLSGNKNETTLEDNEYNYSIAFSILPTGGLPSNLSLGDNGDGSGKISGYINSITQDRYDFLIRASLNVYDKETNILIRTDDTDYYMYFTSIKNDTFFWDTGWLDSLSIEVKNIKGKQYTIYDLGSYPKGSIVDIMLSLNNSSNFNVTYNIESVDITTQTTILPLNTNLYKINNKNVKISGGIDLSIDTSSGNVSYYFNVYATYNNTTGTPDTKNIIFKIGVLNYFVDNTVSSNSIIWDTLSGNIGTSYERYNSHFSVLAYNPEDKPITYQVSPNGNSLPSGLTIDKNLGYIVGILPAVKQKTIYNFTIRAFCGNNFSDRNFSITILPMFNGKSYFDIHLPFTFFKRVLTTSYAWNTNCVPENKVYRNSDLSYGRLLEPSVYLTGGLYDYSNNTGYWLSSDTTGKTVDRSFVEKIKDQTLVNSYKSCFIDKLRNYHKPFNLTINGINWAPCYDPTGEYIYDVVYLTFTDNDENDYRYFDKSNTEETVYINYQYNSENNKRYFQPSIRNCRLDLLQTENRQSNDIFNKRPNTDIGMGLAGNSENLPLWMLTNNPNKNNSSLGYVCCLPIVYTVAGYGNTATILYNQNNISELFGITFTIGGYLVDFYHTIETHFDLNTETGSETTFDVVGGDKDNSGTWFDVNYQTETKYILFPEEGE